MKIDSTENFSTIKIVFHNTSDKKIKQKDLNLKLLDSAGSLILNFTFKMPEIEANSKTDYSIAYSQNIQDVTDYDIELANKSK